MHGKPYSETMLSQRVPPLKILHRENCQRGLPLLGRRDAQNGRDPFAEMTLQPAYLLDSRSALGPVGSDVRIISPRPSNNKCLSWPAKLESRQRLRRAVGRPTRLHQPPKLCEVASRTSAWPAREKYRSLRQHNSKSNDSRGLSATGVIRPLQSRRKPATWRPAMRTAESAYTGHSEVGIYRPAQSRHKPATAQSA